MIRKISRGRCARGARDICNTRTMTSLSRCLLLMLTLCWSTALAGVFKYLNLKDPVKLCAELAMVWAWICVESFLNCLVIRDKGPIVISTEEKVYSFLNRDLPFLVRERGNNIGLLPNTLILLILLKWKQTNKWNHRLIILRGHTMDYMRWMNPHCWTFLQLTLNQIIQNLVII